jgi:phosphatidate cytidylyltransferase
MFKQRLLTAIILIPVFIFLVLRLSPSAFYILTGFMVIGGAWEWSAFMEIKSWLPRLLYVLLVLAVLGVGYLFPITPILYAALMGWLLAAFFVISYPKSAACWREGVIVRGLMGLGVLVPCGLAVNFMRNLPHDGKSILLFLFVLIWSADSGAYFSGKKWGKHKLLPMVSPGKTWQGLGGALSLCAGVILLGLFIFHVPYRVWPAAFLWLLIVVLVSVLGDLFESLLKRQAGLKDSGCLLPGHGGILDRIDSLTAAAPVFALGIIICHWI